MLLYSYVLCGPKPVNRRVVRRHAPRLLEIAYGNASDAPFWLRALNSEDPDLRTDAVHEFLWSSAFHQYTLYSATPFAIKYVIQALQVPEPADRSVGDLRYPMKRELLHFLQQRSRCGQRAVIKPHPEQRRFNRRSPRAQRSSDSMFMMRTRNQQESRQC